MNFQELQRLINYAQKHNMTHKPVIAVYQAWSKELEEAYK